MPPSVTALVEERRLRRGSHAGRYRDHLLPRLAPLHCGLGAYNTTVSFCEGQAGVLLAGSEDGRLTLWHTDYSNAGGSVTRSFDTGHTGAILSARSLAGSSASLLVSCSTDRQVRLLDLNRQAVRPWAVHRARVKALASAGPDAFLSASEDGTVRLYDVRQASNTDAPAMLVEQCCERAGRSSLRISVNTLAVSPTAPHMFVTGGGDPFARMYDMRMLRAPPSEGAATVGAARPPWVSSFAPNHLCTPNLAFGSVGGFSTLSRVRHLTGVAFAGGGEGLLLSYSGEAIYSVDLKAHAMSADDLESRLRRHLTPSPSGMPRAAGPERAAGPAAWEYFSSPSRRADAAAAAGTPQSAQVPTPHREQTLARIDLQDANMTISAGTLDEAPAVAPRPADSRESPNAGQAGAAGPAAAVASRSPAGAQRRLAFFRYTLSPADAAAAAGGVHATASPAASPARPSRLGLPPLPPLPSLPALRPTVWGGLAPPAATRTQAPTARTGPTPQPNANGRDAPVDGGASSRTSVVDATVDEPAAIAAAAAPNARGPSVRPQFAPLGAAVPPAVAASSVAEGLELLEQLHTRLQRVRDVMGSVQALSHEVQRRRHQAAPALEGGDRLARVLQRLPHVREMRERAPDVGMQPPREGAAGAAAAGGAAAVADNGEGGGGARRGQRRARRGAAAAAEPPSTSVPMSTSSGEEESDVRRQPAGAGAAAAAAADTACGMHSSRGDSDSASEASDGAERGARRHRTKRARTLLSSGRGSAPREPTGSPRQQQRNSVTGGRDDLDSPPPLIADSTSSDDDRLLPAPASLGGPPRPPDTSAATGAPASTPGRAHAASPGSTPVAAAAGVPLRVLNVRTRISRSATAGTTTSPAASPPRTASGGAAAAQLGAAAQQRSASGGDAGAGPLTDEQRDVGAVGTMPLASLPPPWGMRAAQAATENGQRAGVSQSPSAALAAAQGREPGARPPLAWSAEQLLASSAPSAAGAAAAASPGGAASRDAPVGAVVEGGSRRPSDGELPQEGEDGDGYVRRFTGHKNVMTVKEVAWFGDVCGGPSYVITGSDDGHVYIFNYCTGDLVRMLPVQEHVIPTSLAVDPLETMLAACGGGTVVRVWAPGHEEAPEGGATAVTAAQRAVVEANRAEQSMRQAQQAELAAARARPVGAGWASFAAAIRGRAEDLTNAATAAAAAAAAAAGGGSPATSAPPLGRAADPRASPQQQPRRAQAQSPVQQQQQQERTPQRQVVRVSTEMGRQRRRSGSPDETIPPFGLSPGLSPGRMPRSLLNGAHAAEGSPASRGGRARGGGGGSSSGDDSSGEEGDAGYGGGRGQVGDAASPQVCALQ